MLEVDETERNKNREREMKVMKFKVFTCVLLGLLLLTGCKQSNSVQEIKEEKTNEVTVVAVDEKSDEILDEEELIIRDVLVPGIELVKRNILLVENDKGSITYVGDLVDELGYFHAALHFTGDTIFQNADHIYFQFIFDDGSSLWYNLSSKDRIQPYENGQIRLITSEETILKDRVLKRIDYSLVPDEEYDEINEEEKISVAVEDSSEMIVVDPIYSLEKTEFTIEEIHEDEEKTILLSHLSLENESGTLRVDGEITYKTDTDISRRIYGKLYRPFDQSITLGESETQQSFFADIPVAFSIEYPTEKLIGDDDGAVVFIEVMDAMFPFNLTTGKQTQEPLILTQKMTTEFHDFLDTIPTEGLKTNQGEIVYNVLSFRQPTWNYGLGTFQKATHPFIIGDKFKTFQFTLASGEEFEVKGGVYDVYIYGDDYEPVVDTDEIKGKQLFHHQISGTDQPKEFEVNVEGVNTLYIYYNTNRKSEGGFGVFDESDPDEQLIQLMMINPTLK